MNPINQNNTTTTAPAAGVSRTPEGTETAAEIGATLELSSYKLCKYRKYEVRLTVPKKWRVDRGLSEVDLLQALLSAKCCRLGSSTEVGCERCAVDRVVVLTATTQWPIRQENNDLETYVCAIQSKCTSSRDHLHSQVVLLITSLPFAQPLTSEAFGLLARDKGQKVPKEDAEAGVVPPAANLSKKRVHPESSTMAAQRPSPQDIAVSSIRLVSAPPSAQEPVAPPEVLTAVGPMQSSVSAPAPAQVMPYTLDISYPQNLGYSTVRVGASATTSPSPAPVIPEQIIKNRTLPPLESSAGDLTHILPEAFVYPCLKSNPNTPENNNQPAGGQVQAGAASSSIAPIPPPSSLGTPKQAHILPSK